MKNVLFEQGDFWLLEMHSSPLLVRLELVKVLLLTLSERLAMLFMTLGKIHTFQNQKQEDWFREAVQFEEKMEHT